MFDSPNSELRWIFPLSELKRSSSMKLRVRYKVEIPTNNLFITFNIKVMHSSNHKINAPVTKHWILSESIEFAFPKNVNSSIILTVLRFGKGTYPTVHVDYMELYRCKDKLNVIRTYDIDDDTVSLDLIGGQSVDNQDLFSIYPDSHDGTDNAISYPLEEISQHFTLRFRS